MLGPLRLLRAPYTAHRALAFLIWGNVRLGAGALANAGRAASTALHGRAPSYESSVAIACLSSGNLRVLPRRIGPDQEADECKEHAAPYENAASRPDNDPSALVGCRKEAADYCYVAEKPKDSGV